MLKKLKRIPKEKAWGYLILSAQFLLAWTFFRYGYGKLADGQFGITPIELATPLEDLDLFRVSWYLFDQQPFKAFIGISQIICAILLIIPRTVILGAFLFLPIVSTILIIDLTFMPPPLAEGFAWRLSFYMLLDLLILWHYKDRMKLIWKAVWHKMGRKFKYPIWAYLVLPIAAIFLELIGILPRAFVQLISDPTKFWKGIKELFSTISQVL